MRKSATGFSSSCRLISLLLILLYIVDAAPASNLHFQPDWEFNKSTVENSHIEHSVEGEYYLRSRCSEMYVRIKPGTKRNKQTISGNLQRRRSRKSIDASGIKGKPYTTIIMESVGPNGRVNLKGKMSQTYLCFNPRGRLVTEHHPKSRCDFIYNTTRDAYSSGTYTQFRLVDNEDWYIGFRRKKSKKRENGKRLVKGKPLPGYKKTQKRFERCYDFTLEPLHKVKRPDGPIDFNALGPTYEPGVEKPQHRIRHSRVQKYEDLSHRKKKRRRNLLRQRMLKQKQDGS